MCVLLLTSKGGAGVAGSAIPILALTLSATNTISVGAVALVLGIHKVMSSAFVFTNIAGNCVATLVVGKRENAVDTVRLRRQLDARVDEEDGLEVTAAQHSRFYRPRVRHKAGLSKQVSAGLPADPLMALLT